MSPEPLLAETVEPSSPIRRAMIRAATALAAVLCLAVLGWMVTYGTGRVFVTAGYLEWFFDAQAHSLLHGQIDVPLEAIDPEAFILHGKAYGYFGPGPALLRLPLNLLFPRFAAHWSRFSMLLASLVSLAAFLLLFSTLERLLKVRGHLRLRAFLRVTWMAGLLLGSTNLFVSQDSQVYEEAVIWGAALAFSQGVCLVRYLLDGGRRWLVLTCAAAFLAFMTRISSGAGPLASLLLIAAALWLRSARVRDFWGASRILPSRGVAAALAGASLLALVLYCGIDYWKFGQVSPPLQYNQQFAMNPARLRQTGPQLFSLANVRYSLPAYFLPGWIGFGGSFPWVRLEYSVPALEQRRTHFDGMEPFTSLPSGCPALFWTALAGTWLCFEARRPELRVLRAPICGALAGGALTLTFGFITYRYVHDFFPWLALASTAAVAHVPLIRRRIPRRLVAGTLALATVYGVWANFAFAIASQRLLKFPRVPEKTFSYLDFCDAADAGPGAVLRYCTRWRHYIEPDAFEAGNAAIEREAFTRADLPVIRSAGPPPTSVLYRIQAPADDQYELAIRYASAEPRPVQIAINGHFLPWLACTEATGGWDQSQQRWISSTVTLRQGPNSLRLVSVGSLPLISMIRLVRGAP